LHIKKYIISMKCKKYFLLVIKLYFAFVFIKKKCILLILIARILSNFSYWCLKTHCEFAPHIYVGGGYATRNFLLKENIDFR